MHTTKAPDAVLTKPPTGVCCARCAEYECRITLLERQLAAWKELEAADLLCDTRNQIRLRTATSRMRQGLPPVPSMNQER